MTIHEGFVKTDKGQYFVQLKDDAAPFGFILCDDDQQWTTPPFKSWKPVEKSEVPTKDLKRLSWLLEG